MPEGTFFSLSTLAIVGAIPVGLALGIRAWKRASFPFEVSLDQPFRWLAQQMGEGSDHEASDENAQRS